MRRAIPIAAFSLTLFIHQAAGQPQASPAPPLTMAQVWTLDAVYADPQHGVTFRHPSTWAATTQFAYLPPALTQSADAKPIAGFGYSEGGFPRKRIVGPYSATNLEGFGIVYAAVAAASTAECNAKAASLSDQSQNSRIVFAGRGFQTYATGSAGMSQSIAGSLYATYSAHICYLFETDVAVASPGALDNIQPLTPAQSRDIQARLLNIMRSVRIAPKE